VHWPTDPAWAHAWHWPRQSTLQQTPSVQKPDAHTRHPSSLQSIPPSALQAVPCGFCATHLPSFAPSFAQ
jgi:hypothetical protein